MATTIAPLETFIADWIRMHPKGDIPYLSVLKHLFPRDHAAIQSVLVSNHQVDPHVAKSLFRHQIAQQTPDWYVQRRAILTASDVASAINENPYCSRQELMLKKIETLCKEVNIENACAGSLITNRPAGEAAMRHGQLYEDEAAVKYLESDHTRATLMFQLGLLIHSKYPFLGGSPDRLTSDGTLVEIKVC